jgi:hypothetical protein
MNTFIMELFVSLFVLKSISDRLRIENEKSAIFQVLYFSPSTLLLMFLPLVLLIWVIFSCEQGKTMKGFLLVPREESLQIKERFGKRGNEFRVDTSRFSIVQSFVLVFSSFLVVLLVACLIFGFLGYLTCENFKKRDIEYLHSLKLRSSINRVHLWSVGKQKFSFTKSRVVIQRRHVFPSFFQMLQFNVVYLVTRKLVCLSLYVNILSNSGRSGQRNTLPGKYV